MAKDVKRYFWEQCYELGDDVHWTLCDSESARDRRVTDYHMVLEYSLPKCMDGRPLSEQEIPKRIVDLLNGREEVTSTARELIEKFQAWVVAEGWDNQEWAPFVELIHKIARDLGIETVES